MKKAEYDLKNTLLAISSLLVIIQGCASLNKSDSTDLSHNSSEILFSLENGNDVYADEFEYAYSKNNFNNEEANTEKDIKEYLDLYIIFKQKVQAAKDLGMDTTQVFLNEFEGYKKSLANSYIQSKDLTEKLIQEAYDRYKEEISAAHILIRLENEDDTLASYHKIDSIRQLAINGQDFAELAKAYSEDPTAKNNGGELGYFTSMRMVYPFESAAYNTPVGQVSEIVRTRFGYHIIKVHNRRPSQGKVSVAHIMIRSTPKDGEEKQQVARDKIFEIHDQLNNGVEWSQLCRQFSEDFNTRNKDGKLPPFGSGQMPKNFSEAAFDLQEIGQYSDPITTPFGWHIVKLNGKESLESYEVMKPKIKNHISRDERVALNKQAILNKLKAENGFRMEIANQNHLTTPDSTLLSGSWEYHYSPEDSMTLFAIGNDRYPVSEFYNYLVAKQKSVRNRKVKAYAKTLYDQFEEKSLMDYEREHLADKNIEYRMLLREYWEGILLFNLMSDKVWNRASEDTLGLSTFYDRNRTKYQWKERAKATIYSAETPQIIDEITTLINNGDSTRLAQDVLLNKYNTKSKLALEVTDGVFERKDHEPLSKVEWKEGMHPTEHNGRYQLVVIEQILPVQQKELNECKGLVISDYQDALEKEWVEELKSQYPASINQKTLIKTLERLEK